jgi:transposase InsO family protein
MSSGVFTRATADQAFCALYNLGEIDVEQWVRQAVREIAPRSLRRWRSLRRAGEINALAVDRGASRRGSGALDQPAIRSWLLGFIAHNPQLSGKRTREYLVTQFPNFDISVRSVERALSALKTDEKVALTRITNPDAWKSKYEPSGENSNAVSRLNEMWEIDASPADVMLTTGRHSIYACIDLYSRRTIIYVTKTPRAEAVCLLLRRAILTWGVPERIKTDNGSDFKARRTVGLLNALEIEVLVSPPYTPKAKAHVERVIKTFQHDCASDLPGFIGHSVSDRKVIEERKSFAQRLGETDDNIFCVELDAPAFQAKCDHWAGVRYEHREHGALRKKSPFQKAHEYAGKIHRIDDVHALDMLLAPVAGVRTTSKKGVRIDNSHYMTPTVLPGTQVFVRMDPADLGRVNLFTPDGLNYLGEGLCPELAGVDPVKALAEFKHQQAELLAERTAPIRKELRDIKKNKAGLADAIARREAEAAGKLVSFPRPSESYSTPALDAAREATSSPTPDQVVVDNKFAAPARQTPVVSLPETKQQRFRRALALEADIAAGIKISTEDALWLGGYQAGPEYQGLRVVYDDFGEAALR